MRRVAPLAVRAYLDSMQNDAPSPLLPATQAPLAEAEPQPVPAASLPKEVGGAKGPEPTRYGDWEHKGRCTDF